ncbi:PmoA family protein [Plantactinospora sp. CA-294935]|uniref:DUF6807 domain-containing protein n=1 Tax=Plantactinospora sp. CA-294935 TaxID=3240012 RepID=UPI003D94D6CC
MPSALDLSVREEDKTLIIRYGDTELGRYVFIPDAAAYEAPKPYMHPIRSLSGVPMTVYRPWDHRWHKGLQMTWSHVSGQNFWGGPTYSHPRGYQDADNLGRIDHVRFEKVTCKEGRAVIDERLSWITSTGYPWIDEHRRQVIHDVDADRGLWALTFETRLTNIAGRSLDFGSPTTHGRPEAGYAGLFWRGPRSWTGGRIAGPMPAAGGELMGSDAPWLAFSSEHDEVDRGGTVLTIAGHSSTDVPIRWFVRREPFAAIAPSPSFEEEFTLLENESLQLRHRFVFIDHICDQEELTRLSAEFAL